MKNFFVVLALFFYCNSFSQWSRANAGVDGGIVFSVYAVPSTNTIYSGSNGCGVFKSSNGGENWIPVNNGITDYGFYPTCFANIGSTIFMGAQYSNSGPGGMYRTTNDGASWQKINNGLSGKAKYITKSISKGTDVFITTDSGVYRSTNLGNNWINITSSLGAMPDADGLFFKGDTLYIGTTQGVYYSSGNFANWIPANTGLPSGAATSFALYNGNLYSTFFGSGVYMSTNNGASWAAANYNLTGTLLNLRCVYVFNNSLYVACNGGVFVLGTNTWNSVSAGLPVSFPYFYWLTSLPGKLITCTYSKGVYISTDNGASWNQKISGLAALGVNAKKIISAGNILYAAVGGNGVYKSTDNGINWFASNNGNGLTTNSVSLIENKLYSLTDDGVFYSTNSGSSWTGMNNGLSGFDLRASCILKDGTALYRGGYNGIFKSTDDGNSWAATSFYGAQKQVTCMVKLNGVIFAGCTGTSPTLLKSADNFASWNAVQFYQSFSPEVFSIYLEGTDMYLGTGHGVHRSTNAGANWTMLNDGLGADPYVSSIIRVGTNLFCTQIFGSRGLFRSHNNGANWVDVTGTNFLFTDFNDIINFDSKIFIATSYAIYYQPQELLTNTFSTSEIANNFSLKQNYPNPFNPETTIKFTIAKNGFVNINIYDISGKLVKTLVNDYKSAGEHKIEFNAEALPTGIYFYKLTAGNFSETKKMLLVK